MTWALTGVAVATAAYSIYSSEQQAGAMEDKANFDKEMMKLNAERAETDAAQTRRDGESSKVAYMGEAEKTKASQEAILASQDINPTKGAGADLIAESNLNMTLNMVDIGYSAFMNSAKYKREANQLRAQGEIDYMAGRTNANNTRISGYASAVNTIGSAAAKADYSSKKPKGAKNG